MKPLGGKQDASEASAPAPLIPVAPPPQQQEIPQPEQQLKQTQPLAPAVKTTITTKITTTVTAISTLAVMSPTSTSAAARAKPSAKKIPPNTVSASTARQLDQSSAALPSPKDSDIHLQAAHVQRLQHALKRPQELPRNWFQCEWIELFSVTTHPTTGERTVSCGVIDDVVLFDWIRKFAFSNLTPTQYRSTVRRNIVSQGPGYVAAPHAADVKRVLTARIEEMGKKNWGFQVMLANRKKRAQAELDAIDAEAANVNDDDAPDTGAVVLVSRVVAATADVDTGASSATAAVSVPTKKRKQPVARVDKAAKRIATPSNNAAQNILAMPSDEGNVKLTDPCMQAKATATAWSPVRPPASLSMAMTSLPMQFISVPSIPSNSGLTTGSLPPPPLSMLLPNASTQQYQPQPLSPTPAYQQHQQQHIQQILHQQRIHQQQLQQQANHQQQMQQHHHNQQQLQYQFQPNQGSAMWALVNQNQSAGVPNQDGYASLGGSAAYPPPQHPMYFNFNAATTPGSVMSIDPRIMQQQQLFARTIGSRGAVTSMSDSATSTTTTQHHL